MHILITDLYTLFCYVRSKEKLSKYQDILSSVITSFILVTGIFNTSSDHVKRNFIFIGAEGLKG